MVLGESFSDVIEACWADDGAIYLGSSALIEFSHLKFCAENDERRRTGKDHIVENRKTNRIASNNFWKPSILQKK